MEDKRFKYHKPQGSQEGMYQTVRSNAQQLTSVIEHLVPNSREKSLALTKIEEAMFWANAGIARNTKWKVTALQYPDVDPETYKETDNIKMVRVVIEKGFKNYDDAVEFIEQQIKEQPGYEKRFDPVIEIDG